MELKLNLIAAACENGGIGINGRLPWSLKSEMNFFTNMTTKTNNINKKNVVLMGRRTWECIPKKYRPLENRINIVLSSQLLKLGNEAFVCKSIPSALEFISKSNLKEQVENVWVIGGSNVYKDAMESPNFHRLYLTEVKKHFDCDTFFPKIPDDFVTIEDLSIPQGIQEEKGINFIYKIYEKKN